MAIIDEKHSALKGLITDTLYLMLKSGITYRKQFKMDGVIGITIDDHSSIIVKLDQFVESEHRSWERANEEEKRQKAELANREEEIELMVEKRINDRLRKRKAESPQQDIPRKKIYREMQCQTDQIELSSESRHISTANSSQVSSAGESTFQDISASNRKVMPCCLYQRRQRKTIGPIFDGIAENTILNFREGVLIKTTKDRITKIIRDWCRVTEKLEGAINETIVCFSFAEGQVRKIEHSYSCPMDQQFEEERKCSQDNGLRLRRIAALLEDVLVLGDARRHKLMRISLSHEGLSIEQRHKQEKIDIVARRQLEREIDPETARKKRQKTAQASLTRINKLAQRKSLEQKAVIKMRSAVQSGAAWNFQSTSSPFIIQPTSDSSFDTPVNAEGSQSGTPVCRTIEDTGSPESESEIKMEEESSGDAWSNNGDSNDL